jgi:hypothetical protein
MSEYKVKLAAALPKAEANGFDDYTISAALAATVTEGRSVQPRVALLVYDVKKVEVDPEGTETVHLRMRRVQPVLTVEGRRQAEQMLADEFAGQTGQALLPYDLSALSKSAFADLPRSTEEIDEKEAREQDMMSPTDELRRHLERVHGTEEAHLLTAEATEEKHRADHEGDALGPLAHDAGWFGWTRADLEAAEFEADESGSAEINEATAEHSMQADFDADAVAEIVDHGPVKPPYGSPERATYDSEAGLFRSEVSN